MAEVGVINDFRNRGLCTTLVKARIAVARTRRGYEGVTHGIMRTAKEKSNSRSIYEKLEATEIPELYQLKDNDGSSTAAPERVFLHMPL